MSAVADAAKALQAALETIPGMRVYGDPGAALDPPALVLGPPALIWEGACLGPTTARFLVYVVEAADSRALERLWEWVPQVADAIDSMVDAVVVRADPGTYTTGGVELPCYEITTEVSL